MTITSVNTATFIGDTTILIRDEIKTNIIDPIASERTARQGFVFTSYPEKDVKYPIITILLDNIQDPTRLGQQSELMMVTLPLEIRIWARNQKEKDELTQQVSEHLRANQLGTGGSIEAELHDFRITSAVNVDEIGETKPKSRVLRVEYDFLLGAT